MSKKQLFVALLSLLICAPSYAGATLDGEISAAQEQDANGNGLTDEAISRELELFRGAEVSLRQALKIADRLHPGSRIVDVSFDGGSGSSVYRVRMFRQDRIWADTIDAKTGQVAGNATVSSMSELNLEDRTQLDRHAICPARACRCSLRSRGQHVRKSAQRRTDERSRQIDFCDRGSVRHQPQKVMLEPPSANNLETLPRRSKQH